MMKLFSPHHQSSPSGKIQNFPEIDCVCKYIELYVNLMDLHVNFKALIWVTRPWNHSLLT